MNVITLERGTQQIRTAVHGFADRYLATRSGYQNVFLIAVCTGLEPVTPCVTGMYSNQLN